MKIYDKKIKKNIKRYFLQCLLATLSILVILLFLNLFIHTTIIACLGATTFIVFAIPNSYGAQPRNLIGGYLCGIIVGIIGSLLSNYLLSSFFIGKERILFIVFGSIAVGLAIFIMVITDTEHPPAAGLALGLVLGSWDYITIIIIICSILLMSGIKKVLGSVLIDLR